MNANTNPPVLTCPRATIAAIKRLLVKAGYSIARTTGVYAPYSGNTKACTEGFRVRKIGYSRSIVVEYTLGYDARGTWHDYLAGAREVLTARNAEARALLAERGYVLDADYAGIKITCEHYDA